MSEESAKSCRRLKEWGGQLLGPEPGRWRYFGKKEKKELQERWSGAAVEDFFSEGGRSFCLVILGRAAGGSVLFEEQAVGESGKERKQRDSGRA